MDFGGFLGHTAIINLKIMFPVGLRIYISSYSYSYIYKHRISNVSFSGRPNAKYLELSVRFTDVSRTITFPDRRFPDKLY